MKNKAYILDDEGFMTEVETIGSHKSGCETVFVPISKRIGIKGFETLIEASSSIDRQTQAWVHGVAPKVLSEIIEVILPVGKTNLGSHFNKKACGSTIYHKKHRRLYDYKTQIASRVGEKISFSSPEYKHLESTMNQLGFCKFDLHSQNMGWIGKRLVCIDFGDMSA